MNACIYMPHRRPIDSPRTPRPHTHSTDPQPLVVLSPGTAGTPLSCNSGGRRTSRANTTGSHGSHGSHGSAAQASPGGHGASPSLSMSLSRSLSVNGHASSPRSPLVGRGGPDLMMMMDLSASGASTSSSSSVVMVAGPVPAPSPLSLLCRQGREARRRRQAGYEHEEDEADWVRVEEGEEEEEEEGAAAALTPKAGAGQRPKHQQQQQQQQQQPFTRRRGGSGLVHELGEGPMTAAGGVLAAVADDDAAATMGAEAAAAGAGAYDDGDESEEEESSEEEEEELVHGGAGAYVFRRKAGTISVSGFDAAIGEGGILSEVGGWARCRSRGGWVGRGCCLSVDGTAARPGQAHTGSAHHLLSLSFPHLNPSIQDEFGYGGSPLGPLLSPSASPGQQQQLPRSAAISNSLCISVSHQHQPQPQPLPSPLADSGHSHSSHGSGRNPPFPHHQHHYQQPLSPSLHHSSPYSPHRRLSSSHSPLPRFRVPMRDRLVLLGRLGQGCSGIVHKAFDLLELRLVALKVCLCRYVGRDGCLDGTSFRWLGQGVDVGGCGCMDGHALPMV